MSYAAALMRRLLDALQLLFSLRMTIGSVLLNYSISMGSILAFAIRPISSDFYLFDC